MRREPPGWASLGSGGLQQGPASFCPCGLPARGLSIPSLQPLLSTDSYTHRLVSGETEAQSSWVLPEGEWGPQDLAALRMQGLRGSQVTSPRQPRRCPPPSTCSAEPACFRASLPSGSAGVTLLGVVGVVQGPSCPPPAAPVAGPWAAFLRPKDPSAPRIIPSLSGLGLQPTARGSDPTGCLSISMENKNVHFPLLPSRLPLGPSGRWPWLRRGHSSPGSGGPRRSGGSPRSWPDPLLPPLAAQGGPAALTENVPLPRQHGL